MPISQDPSAPLQSRCEANDNSTREEKEKKCKMNRTYAWMNHFVSTVKKVNAAMEAKKRKCKMKVT